MKDIKETTLPYQTLPQNEKGKEFISQKITPVHLSAELKVESKADGSGTIKLLLNK